MDVHVENVQCPISKPNVGIEKVVQISLMGYFHSRYLTFKCMGFLCVMLLLFFYFKLVESLLRRELNSLQCFPIRAIHRLSKCSLVIFTWLLNVFPIETPNSIHEKAKNNGI